MQVYSPLKKNITSVWRGGKELAVETSSYMYWGGSAPGRLDFHPPRCLQIPYGSLSFHMASAGPPPVLK